MSLLMLLFSASAFAQYPQNGVYTCEYVQGGKIVFLSGVSGCTEKHRSPKGDTVTYQQTVSHYDVQTGKIVPEPKTFTMKLEKRDGNLLSTSYFEGEDAKKANLITTQITNPDARDPQNALTQTLVVQRRDGKEERFLTFDRNLCARFREAGNLEGDFKAMNACATVLPKYEDAAREWNSKLKTSKTALGVANYDGRGMMYRPAQAGSILDLIAIASACGAGNMGYMGTYQAPMPAQMPFDASKSTM